MTIFTEHEQQQIRDGIKTQHRVLMEPQPPSKPFQIHGEQSGDWFVDNRTHTHHVLGCWRGRPPHKPGSRIPCDGGDVVVGGVRAEQIQSITEADAKTEGMNGGCLECGTPQPCECENPSPDYRDSFIWYWCNKHPDHPFASNPWVWVLEQLTWEPTQ